MTIRLNTNSCSKSDYMYKNTIQCSNKYLDGASNFGKWVHLCYVLEQSPSFSPEAYQSIKHGTHNKIASNKNNGLYFCRHHISILFSKFLDFSFLFNINVHYIYIYNSGSLLHLTVCVCLHSLVYLQSIKYMRVKMECWKSILKREILPKPIKQFRV